MIDNIHKIDIIAKNGGILIFPFMSTEWKGKRVSISVTSSANSLVTHPEKLYISENIEQVTSFIQEKLHGAIEDTNQ
jgi:hypothetical protein